MLSDRVRIIRYGILPALTAAALVGAYFSGVPPLMSLVALPGQREYGVLENLQNLLLILIAVRAWRAARREASPRLRIAGRGLALFAVFVLMEEIDWGDHYYATITGEKYLEGELFNLHNKGEVTGWTKRIVDLGVVLGFVIVPLFLRERVPVRLRAWVPDPHSLLTILVGVAASRSAHYLEDHGWPNNEALRSNISEFREVFLYWLAWLYLGEIVRRRGLASSLQESQEVGNPDASGAHSRSGSRPSS